MGREELKWCQLAHDHLSSQGPYGSPHSTAKTSNERTNLRKNGTVSSGITDVAFASVYSEKTCLKKLIYK